MLDLEEIKSKIQEFEKRQEEIDGYNADLVEDLRVLQDDIKRHEENNADVLTNGSQNPVKMQREDRERTSLLLDERSDELPELAHEIDQLEEKLDQEVDEFVKEIIEKIQEEKNRINVEVQEPEISINRLNAEKQQLENDRKSFGELIELAESREYFRADDAIYKDLKRREENVNARIAKIDNELEELDPDRLSDLWDELDGYEKIMAGLKGSSKNKIDNLCNTFDVKTQEQLRQEAELIEPEEPAVVEEPEEPEEPAEAAELEEVAEVTSEPTNPEQLTYNLSVEVDDKMLTKWLLARIANGDLQYSCRYQITSDSKTNKIVHGGNYGEILDYNITDKLRGLGILMIEGSGGWSNGDRNVHEDRYGIKYKKVKEFLETQKGKNISEEEYKKIVQQVDELFYKEVREWYKKMIGWKETVEAPRIEEVFKISKEEAEIIMQRLKTDKELNKQAGEPIAQSQNDGDSKTGVVAETQKPPRSFTTETGRRTPNLDGAGQAKTKSTSTSHSVPEPPTTGSANLDDGIDLDAEIKSIEEALDSQSYKITIGKNGKVKESGHLFAHKVDQVIYKNAAALNEDYKLLSTESFMNVISESYSSTIENLIQVCKENEVPIDFTIIDSIDDAFLEDTTRRDAVIKGYIFNVLGAHYDAKKKAGELDAIKNIQKYNKLPYINNISVTYNLNSLSSVSFKAILSMLSAKKDNFGYMGRATDETEDGEPNWLDRNELTGSQKDRIAELADIANTYEVAEKDGTYHETLIAKIIRFVNSPIKHFLPSKNKILLLNSGNENKTETQNDEQRKEQRREKLAEKGLGHVDVEPISVARKSDASPVKDNSKTKTVLGEDEEPAGH